MKATRILDQIARGTDRYVGSVKTGRKNRPLATSLFDLCDDLRQRVDSEQAKTLVSQIAAETETLIRLAHAADGTEFYAAWARQRDAITDLRAVIASEGAAS